MLNVVWVFGLSSYHTVWNRMINANETIRSVSLKQMSVICFFFCFFVLYVFFPSSSVIQQYTCDTQTIIIYLVLYVFSQKCLEDETKNIQFFCGVWCCFVYLPCELFKFISFCFVRLWRQTTMRIRLIILFEWWEHRPNIFERKKKHKTKN